MAEADVQGEAAECSRRGGEEVLPATEESLSTKDATVSRDIEQLQLQTPLYG